MTNSFWINMLGSIAMLAILVYLIVGKRRQNFISESTPAKFSIRGAAYLIDMTILTIGLTYTIGTKVNFETGFYLPILLVPVISAIYKISCEKLYGQTIGKSLVGIYVVAADQQPFTWERMLRRYSFYAAKDFFVIGMGMLLYAGGITLRESEYISFTNWQNLIENSTLQTAGSVITFLLIFDWLSMNFQMPNKGQTLHDRLASTLVLDPKKRDTVNGLGLLAIALLLLTIGVGVADFFFGTELKYILEQAKEAQQQPN